MPGSNKQKAYDDARAKLLDQEGKPTAHYQAYLRYEAEYKRKVKAWHKAQASASSDPMKLQNWPIEGASYQDDADKAMDRWVSLGYKQEIENAIAILTAQGTDPAIAQIIRDRDKLG
jgi:hypothetical protein